MNDLRGLEDTARPHNRFALKIVLIAVVLMAVSQVIGTLISVSTFETLLLTTLTDKYKILGTNLKRKIEHSLKFGKRLDHFMGMDKLVAPVYDQTEDIHEVMIFNKQGRLFFYSQRIPASSRHDTNPEKPTGKPFRVDNSRTRTDLPVALFTQPGPEIRLYQNRYHVLFPIQSPLDNTSAVLALTFHRSILDERKKELMQDAWHKLLVSLFLTAAVMGIMIHFFFTRPFHKHAEKLVREMPHPTAPRIPNEPTADDYRKLAMLLFHFQSKSREAEAELTRSLHALEELPPDEYTADTIRRIKGILTGESS